MRLRLTAVLLTGAVALAALGALLAAAEDSRTGRVTGVAAPCVGVTTEAVYAATPVRISLLQGGHTVSTEIVHGRSRFRLLAPPGSYLLFSNAMQGARLLPQPVTVKANESVRLALIPRCK
jgi:hypothetical protein